MCIYLIQNYISLLFKNNYLLPGCFLLLFGSILLYVPIYMLFQIIKSFNYIETIATITSYEKSNKNEHQYRYCAEYYIEDNKYTVLSTYSSTSTGIFPPIGTQIKIKFNPLNPEEAIISPILLLSLSILIFIISGILIYFGYILATNQIPTCLKPFIEMF